MANTKMALLYNSGFSDFSHVGVCEIHKTIFSDVYDWAGQYRIINVQKREPLLAGKSVWYSNWENIDLDLKTAWKKIDAVDWQDGVPSKFHRNAAHGANNSNVSVCYSIKKASSTNVS